MKLLRHLRNRFLLLILLLFTLWGCIPDAEEGGSVFTSPFPPDTQPSISSSTEVSTNASSDDSDYTLPANSESTTLSGLTVRFLDVGQADAALITYDGHSMLIDGGNKDDSSLLYSLLRAQDITNLDLVIGTHADEDHIGGLPGAFYFAEAELTLCSSDTYDSDAFSDFEKYAALRGGGIRIPAVGDTFSLGDAEVEILAVNSDLDSNDSSIVTRITYGTTSFLFTGDSEDATEEFLLNSDTDLKSTVLKVAHHGSEGSSSTAFLERVMPEYAVISVGADNLYGHPSSKTLKRLEETGAEIYRTDYQGDILFHSDGTNVTVHTEHEELKHTSGNELQIPGIDSSSESSYILNIRSKKFHRPSCESVAKMSEQNKLTFTGSREEALALDYTPCGACKP